MDPIGQQLKAAREKKRISLSQAAAKTHIKIQHIEALEKDDFGKIPAPTYAKGFIKMYAEFLELDPAPLTKSYTDQYAPKARPSIMPDQSAATGVGGSASPGIEIPWREGLKQAREILARVSWRRIASASVVLVVLILASIGITRCAARLNEDRPEATVVKTGSPARRNPLALAREPAEPYLDVKSTAAAPP